MSSEKEDSTVSQLSEERPQLVTKVYGRSPVRPVTVEMNRTLSPTAMISDLNSFMNRDVSLRINYNDKAKNLHAFLHDAILDKTTHEHRIFRQNLDVLVEENIKELGYDPRVEGPPEHIKNQTYATMEDRCLRDTRERKVPVHSKSTSCSIKKVHIFPKKYPIWVKRPDDPVQTQEELLNL